MNERNGSKADRDRRLQRQTARRAKQYMQQATRLAEQIDELFDGEPFDHRFPPDHRRNVRRFRQYVFTLERSFRLFSKGFDLWRRARASLAIAPQTNSTTVPARPAHVGNRGRIDPIAGDLSIKDY